MWEFSEKCALCPQKKHVIWTWHFVVDGFLAAYQFQALPAALDVKVSLAFIPEFLGGSQVPGSSQCKDIWREYFFSMPLTKRAFWQLRFQNYTVDFLKRVLSIRKAIPGPSFRFGKLIGENSRVHAWELQREHKFLCNFLLVCCCYY